ncbi:MAG: hypothetical protein J2O49_08440, partial [Sciscionella sp.]|nr:hypothetical protein [Sciscionella sp.]
AALVTFCAVFAACTLAAGVDLGWIDTLRTQLSLSTWMSVPNLISDFSYHFIGVFFASATPAGFAGVLRPAALVVLAGLLAVLWWRARDGGRGAIRYAAIALLAGAALGPSVLPWYYVWPLALAAAFALRDRWLVAVAGLSIWMVAMTNPDGTIIARWPWGASAWLTWCYIAAASVGAVFVARTLNRPLPPTALVESGSTPAAVDDHAVA